MPDTDNTLLFIVFAPSFEDRVTAILANEGWTMVPRVWGHGEGRSFHDDRAWPGHLCAMSAIVASKDVASIVDRLRALSEQTRPEAGSWTPPLHAYAWSATPLL